MPAPAKPLPQPGAQKADGQSQGALAGSLGTQQTGTGDIFKDILLHLKKERDMPFPARPPV